MTPMTWIPKSSRQSLLLTMRGAGIGALSGTGSGAAPVAGPMLLGRRWGLDMDGQMHNVVHDIHGVFPGNSVLQSFLGKDSLMNFTSLRSLRNRVDMRPMRQKLHLPRRNAPRAQHRSRRKWSKRSQRTNRSSRRKRSRSRQSRKQIVRMPMPIRCHPRSLHERRVESAFGCIILLGCPCKVQDLFKGLMKYLPL